MKKRNVVIGLGMVLALGAAAQGQTWNEQGDAGDMPAVAQVCAGSGTLAEIQGSIGHADDADMYVINITSAGSFEATTVNGSTIDTQLFLFDMSGNGVTHNDDDPQGGGFRSRISSIFLPGPGEYYLAISTYDFDPMSGGGEIWEDTPFGEERQPDGPGAGSPISGWATEFQNTPGSYTIFLTGAEFVGNCDPDCNEDGSLNTLDFLCFLNAFNTSDPYADYNGDGTINTLDFLAYLNAYNAGCE